MKNTQWLLGVVISLFILTGCGSTAYVQKDKSFDISKVRSYAWVDGTQQDKNNATTKTRINDLTDRKIRQSIDKNLQANGWKEVNNNPDVLLVYDVDVQNENRNVSSPVYSQPTTRWFYNPYSRRYVSVYYPSQFVGYDNSTQTIKEGTLTLTMLNADTDKTIWQGWTTSEVNGKNLTDREIDNNVKAIIKKLDRG